MFEFISTNQQQIWW